MPVNSGNSFFIDWPLFFKNLTRMKVNTAEMMRGSGILYREERMRRLVIERITHEFFAKPIRKVILLSGHTSQDIWRFDNPVLIGTHPA